MTKGILLVISHLLSSYTEDRRFIESYLLACKAKKVFVISPTEYLDLVYEKEELADRIYYDDFISDVLDRIFSRYVSIRQLKIAISHFEVREWEKGLKAIKIDFM